MAGTTHTARLTSVVEISGAPLWMSMVVVAHAAVEKYRRYHCVLSFMGCLSARDWDRIDTVTSTVL